MIFYREEFDKTLTLQTGVLVVSDPFFCGSEEGIALPCPSTARIAILHSYDEDYDLQLCAALELSLRSKSSCDRYRKITKVCVDSASAVLGDAETLGSCPDDFLILHKEVPRPRLRSQLVSRFNLQTRRIGDRTDEIISDACEPLYQKMHEFLTKRRGVEARDYVSYFDTNGLVERCSWSDSDFLETGKGEVFRFNIGADGIYDVVAGYESEDLVKIWVVCEDDLYMDGRISFESRPLSSLPRRKHVPIDVSRPEVEWLRRILDQHHLSKKKHWWKFW